MEVTAADLYCKIHADAWLLSEDTFYGGDLCQKEQEEARVEALVAVVGSGACRGDVGQDH